MAKGYIIAHVEVTEQAGYDEYRKGVGAAVAAFGGRFLVRGGDPERLEGEGKTRRVVVLEFDSPARAKEWYHSRQYQEILPLRLGAAKADLFLVKGVDP
ncbi:MAG TPA: DUF1330 domain-containing protein [Acetobacteraceae bacterium]